MKQRQLFLKFVQELSVRLSNPLPGLDAKLKMAPPMRNSYAYANTKSPGCSEAAILALFFPSEVHNEPAELLLTVRPEGMSNHAGQVAFPGGRCEKNESLERTALRETEEEVAIVSSSIKVLGPLTPLFIPPSNFFVHPFVGYTSNPPDLQATSDEVARIFSVPVSHLIDPSVEGMATRKIKSETHEIPFLALNGEFVWGATAMILAELISAISSMPVLNQIPS